MIFVCFGPVCQEEVHVAKCIKHKNSCTALQSF